MGCWLQKTFNGLECFFLRATGDYKINKVFFLKLTYDKNIVKKTKDYI